MIYKQQNEKKSDISKTAGGEIVTSIRVISFLAGIFALIFADTVGLGKLDIIGIKGLIIINISVLLSIFAMLIFVKALIDGEGIKAAQFIIYMIVIGIIAAGLFLLANPSIL